MDIMNFFGPDISKLIDETPDVLGDNFAFWKPLADSSAPHVCLVAHIDTVFPCTTQPPKVSNYKGLTILSRDTGLGADDRAGLFAVLVLRKITGCSMLLTDLEESGGIGAREAAKTLKDHFKEHTHFFVEMDRQGENDMVFYNNETKKFVNFVGNFGFKKATGSFTDISILGRETGIAGVNISVGYMKAHTKDEILIVDYLYANINKVQRLIEAKNRKRYYIGPQPVSNWGSYCKSRDYYAEYLRDDVEFCGYDYYGQRIVYHTDKPIHSEHINRHYIPTAWHDEDYEKLPKYYRDCHEAGNNRLYQQGMY